MMTRAGNGITFLANEEDKRGMGYINLLKYFLHVSLQFTEHVFTEIDLAEIDFG